MTAARPALLARRPEVLLALVTFFWGSTFIVTKDIVRGAPPLAYLVIRFGGAAVVMLLVVPRALRPSRRLLADTALLGFLQALGLVLQVFAQVYTTASKAAFVTALAVQAVAVLLASVGLVLLTYPEGGAQWNRGDLYAAACAVVYALVIVETARRVRGADATAFAALQTAAAALTFALALVAARALLQTVPVAALPAVIQLESRHLILDGKLVGQLTYMSLVCTVATFFAQTWAMGRMAATHAAVVFALEPVFATGLATAIEGASEWPGARGAIGAALVLSGVVASELGRGSAKKEG
jgi:drug/metabolite transporter (DMT)-like permease